MARSAPKKEVFPSHPILEALITQFAPRLHVPPGVDAGRLLKAIAKKESSYGRNRTPRFEPAYYTGGRYCTPDQAAQIALYGKEAAKSFGAWQILFPVARELGYRGTPQGLNEDVEGIRWVVHYINSRAIARDRAASVSQIADAYNSGNARDKIIPVDYIAKVTQYYEEGESA